MLERLPWEMAHHKAFSCLIAQYLVQKDHEKSSDGIRLEPWRGLQTFSRRHAQVCGLQLMDDEALECQAEGDRINWAAGGTYAPEGSVLDAQGGPVETPADEASVLETAACCALCNDSALTYDTGALFFCCCAKIHKAMCLSESSTQAATFSPS